MHQEYLEKLNLLAENDNRYDFILNCINTPERSQEHFRKATTSNYLINATVALLGAIMLVFGVLNAFSSKPNEISFLIIPGVFFFISFFSRFSKRKKSLNQLRLLIEKYVL